MRGSNFTDCWASCSEIAPPCTALCKTLTTSSTRYRGATGKHCPRATLQGGTAPPLRPLRAETTSSQGKRPRPRAGSRYARGNSLSRSSRMMSVESVHGSGPTFARTSSNARSTTCGSVAPNARCQCGGYSCSSVSACSRVACSTCLQPFVIPPRSHCIAACETVYLRWYTAAIRRFRILPHSTGRGRA